MKVVEEIWFWFALLVCPFVCLFGAYHLGALLGVFALPDTPSTPLYVQLAFVGGGISAGFVFARALNQAKLRFSSRRD